MIDRVFQNSKQSCANACLSVISMCFLWIQTREVYEALVQSRWMHGTSVCPIHLLSIPPYSEYVWRIQKVSSKIILLQEINSFGFDFLCYPVNYFFSLSVWLRPVFFEQGGTSTSCLLSMLPALLGRSFPVQDPSLTCTHRTMCTVLKQICVAEAEILGQGVFRRGDEISYFTLSSLGKKPLALNVAI